MSSYVLLFVGLLMVFLEFYLPGGVMGTIGGLIVLTSIVLFGIQSESIVYTFLFILLAVVAISFLFRFALWRIKNDKSIYSNQDQEGFIASTFDIEAIDKEGVVATDLRPGGHISIDGKRHSAISKTGYIVKGDKVRVISGEGESLIVRKV